MSPLNPAGIPKAELHVHLESTVETETCRELAARYGLPEPSRGPFRDLSEFVVGYERTRDLIRSLDDLHRVAREFAERQVRDGVTWTEPHFIPTTYEGRLGSADALVETVLDGLHAGAGPNRFGLILGINRGHPLTVADEAAEVAIRWAGSGVVALGLAGDEAHNPGPRFADVFARAAAAGLPAVPHAGEGVGATSVTETIDALRPTRICHGFRVIDDDAAVNRVLDDGICLDMAPSSNVLLNGVSSLKSHPLPTLRDRGVTVTINSDIPVFIGHGLAQEYAAAAGAWGMSDGEMLELAENSILAAFCPTDVKRTALAQINDLRSELSDSR
ncbi:MAG: adenosine deaminase [Actinomycetia bacterium]|nr:adenosine deaminase [Actinomycetes bacterium]